VKRFVANQIQLLLLPMLALACKDEQAGTRQCVDKDLNVVDERRCDGVGEDAHTHSTFFWYYMGRLNAGRLSGGYYAPRTGYYYAAPSGRVYHTSSGGFFGSSPTPSRAGEGTTVRGLSGMHGGSVSF
jgi:hypothetical protein